MTLARSPASSCATAGNSAPGPERTFRSSRRRPPTSAAGGSPHPGRESAAKADRRRAWAGRLRRSRRGRTGGSEGRGARARRRTRNALAGLRHAREEHRGEEDGNSHQRQHGDDERDSQESWMGACPVGKTGRKQAGGSHGSDFRGRALRSDCGVGRSASNHGYEDAPTAAYVNPTSNASIGRPM